MAAMLAGKEWRLGLAEPTALKARLLFRLRDPRLNREGDAGASRVVAQGDRAETVKCCVSSTSRIRRCPSTSSTASTRRRSRDGIASGSVKPVSSA
jgi:hypothetical protein